ncbi:MAG: CRISPR-associated protein Cas4 [Methanobacteriaceae archaeon]
MIQYYIACKRELWLFANQINMNYNNEDISIGRLIHERSYSREKKNINLGEVSFDFIKKGQERAIFEVKKSSKLEEPVRWQLYYYLWYVKKSGNEVKGVLVYPEERKREKLELTPAIESKIENMIIEIEKIVSQPIIPPITVKPYCKRCTYYELCFV